MKSITLLLASSIPATLAAHLKLFQKADYVYQIWETDVKPLACVNVPMSKSSNGFESWWDVNDRTTSIQIDNNVQCRFWDSANCADKEYLTVWGWNPNVGARWNDRISSLSCFA